MISLENQLAEVHQKESVILKEIDERNKKRTIPCGGCKNLHEIGQLTAIQTHWYTPPHGCTGGDYWNEGELQFVCPETGTINRLLFDNHDVPWQERNSFQHDPAQQFNRMYKKLFKEVVDRHEKMTGELRVNNHYVDTHRGEFGLVEKREAKTENK